MKFRDRDAPVTGEGLIFRTYGYDHPNGACFCDLEYAPEAVYKTDNPRAVRDGRPMKHYKFYFDNGLRFVKERYPQYQIRHRALDRMLVGVREEQLARVVRPDIKLRELMNVRDDPLAEEATEVVNIICDASELKPEDFGVFGSLAHGFHNQRYSDLDFIIYGKKQSKELRATLAELYSEGILTNEFKHWNPSMPPLHWNFTRYSKEEYGWCQERKLIYALKRSERMGRPLKIEFEPVRRWDEVENEYDKTVKIEDLGRVEAVVEVLTDEDSGFMPSMYSIELEKMDRKMDPADVRRIVSYVEEFRLQLQTEERAIVRGNLEKVESTEGEFHQITLSYGGGYFDQVLKPMQ